MRFLIIIAVAALTAILATVIFKTLDVPWLGDPTIRAGVVGGLAGGISVLVGGKIRKDRQ